jgi:hypothetical protein
MLWTRLGTLEGAGLRRRRGQPQCFDGVCAIELCTLDHPCSVYDDDASLYKHHPTVWR